MHGNQGKIYSFPKYVECEIRVLSKDSSFILKHFLANATQTQDYINLERIDFKCQSR